MVYEYDVWYGSDYKGCVFAEDELDAIEVAAHQFGATKMEVKIRMTP